MVARLKKMEREYGETYSPNFLPARQTEKMGEWSATLSRSFSLTIDA